MTDQSSQFQTYQLSDRYDRETGRVDAASDPRGGGEVTVY